MSIQETSREGQNNLERLWLSTTIVMTRLKEYNKMVAGLALKVQRATSLLVGR